MGRPPKGYRLLCIRTLSLKELAPEGYLLVIPEDSRYNKVVSGMFRKPAYSLWAIYESMTDSTNRFSVVFLCTEGATGYQALYYPTLTRPEVVAVVAPGDGFGGNCFSFQDEKDILGKSVLEFHPAGRPRWLVTHSRIIWNAETEFRNEFIDGLVLCEIRKPSYSCKNGIVPKLISETHLPDWAVAVHRKVHERSQNWNHLEIRVWNGGHTKWQKYLGHSENDFSWKTDEAEFYLRMPPVYSSTSKWIFNEPESHYKDFKQMEHDELMAKVSGCYWEMGSTFRSRNKPEVGR